MPNDRNNKNKKKKRMNRAIERSSSDDSSSESSSSSSSSRSGRRQKRKSDKNRRRKYTSSDSSSSSNRSPKRKQNKTSEKQINPKLIEKLRARGETLEEREERRKERRAAKIAAQFGYTADDNPFNDPNLADSFTWKKRTEKQNQQSNAQISAVSSKAYQQEANFREIEKVRMRRRLAEERKEELERIKMEEAKLQQYEQYDEWAQKEEEFHLQQLRLKTATRLVQGREKVIDVLAKNLLLFAISTQDLLTSSSLIKYKEKYNVLEEMDATLDAELEEPYTILQHLKLSELQTLLQDIAYFQNMEKMALSTSSISTSTSTEKTAQMVALEYWDALATLTQDEIQKLENQSTRSQGDVVESIQNMLHGQSKAALGQMKTDIQSKLQQAQYGTQSFVEDGFDVEYWNTVLQQLLVTIAKMTLSEIHERMLVSQLEKLEKRKEERRNIPIDPTYPASEETHNKVEVSKSSTRIQDSSNTVKDQDFGDLEEELGLVDEVDLSQFFKQEYTGQDRNRPRKPRYFNRVKTGYDWNKYNQTHYDHDNPPPRVVQGYKFNIFYPDLLDKTKTPQFFLEPAESQEFCIIRFHAGPPYEDIAFKIINQEWNRSRKHGYRCFFERGVLSLYFNFKSHWYRR